MDTMMSEATIVDRLEDLFQSIGQRPYGEEVSQLQHALQCACLAEQQGASDSLVAAALLHDVGHLFEDPAKIEETDLRHEEVAAEFLREHFPASVWQPIRLHVAAKRYLCATQAGYAQALSAGSRQSLALQGGIFTPAQCEAFDRSPFARDALLLRQLDDLGKDPAMVTPTFAHYRHTLTRLMLSAAG